MTTNVGSRSQTPHDRIVQSVYKGTDRPECNVPIVYGQRRKIAVNIVHTRYGGVGSKNKVLLIVIGTTVHKGNVHDARYGQSKKETSYQGHDTNLGLHGMQWMVAAYAHQGMIVRQVLP